MKRNYEPTSRPSSQRAPGRSFHRHWIAVAICAIGLLGMGLISARAATQNPPDLMAYQGYLTDANGAVLAPTTPVNYAVTFKIYSVATGGSSLWSEMQTVTVDKGNFSVLLGVGAAVPSEPHAALNTVFIGGDASDRYIEMVPTINNVSTVMSPRLHLVSSPYAMLAKTAIGLYGNDGSSVINMNADKLSAGTVADARLSANVALRNAANTFSAAQTFSVGVTANAGIAFLGNVRGWSDSSTIEAPYIVGRGTVPIGTITAYYGELAALPSYWHECDGGTYSGRATPNLRGRFIVGAGSGSAMNTSYNTSGGSTSVTLYPGNLPPHTHQTKDGVFSERSNWINGAFWSEYLGYNNYGSGDSDGDNTYVYMRWVTTEPGNGLNSTPFSILPPWYSLYYIMRVQ